MPLRVKPRRWEEGKEDFVLTRRREGAKKTGKILFSREGAKKTGKKAVCLAAAHQDTPPEGR
ncbi:MAG: hypothetical protein PHT80_01330 [Lentisphaeria bacterium]|nr:hypothetical protein [Lentisphaeria bacterium]